MPKCTKTKKNGDPCGAGAVTGQTQCAGHLGLGIASDPKTYGSKANKASVKARQARVENRKRGFLTALAAKTHDHAEAIAENWVMQAKDDVKAAESLTTRLYGRPVERIELDTPADPMGVQAMTPQERSRLLAQVLEQHPELRALIPTHGQHLLEQ